MSEELPTRRVITTIVEDPRAPGNLVVEVNGARFASLPADAVSRLRLAEGKPLDEAGFARLERAANVEAAYRVAVRLLALRPRAVNELLRRLRDRGHDPSAVGAAVGRLEEQGLLDDHEFARHFARVRSSRGHGPGRLITDLLARGVDRRKAEQAVYEVLDAEEVDVLGQARSLAEKRCGQLGDLPAGVKQRRLLAYLGRRGYHGYEVREIVREVVGSE